MYIRWQNCMTQYKNGLEICNSYGIVIITFKIHRDADFCTIYVKTKLK